MTDSVLFYTHITQVHYGLLKVQIISQCTTLVCPSHRQSLVVKMLFVLAVSPLYNITYKILHIKIVKLLLALLSLPLIDPYENLKTKKHQLEIIAILSLKQNRQHYYI